MGRGNSRAARSLRANARDSALHGMGSARLGVRVEQDSPGTACPACGGDRRDGKHARTGLTAEWSCGAAGGKGQR